MACTWTAPEPFPTRQLGAPFIDMQPSPPAGMAHTLFDLAEPSGALNTAVAALQGGNDPKEVLADFALALGDGVERLTAPLPGGAGSETRAMGPVFAAGDFDDGTTGRQAMADALKAALAPRQNVAGAFGCVDTSIAFVNHRFRKPDPSGGPDKTRFEMLWVQGRSLSGAPAYGTLLRCGTFLLRQDIDDLIARHWVGGELDERAVYAEFSAPPESERDLWNLSGGHGTSVLDLMTGEYADQAPDDRPIFGVELPVAVVRDTSGALFHGPLTFGLGLITLASYVLAEDGTGAPAPWVANVSMSYLGGPHDGTHPTAAALQSIATLATGPAGATRSAALTLPAGNHLQEGVHARAVPQNATTLNWSAPPEDRTASFVEIWSSDDGHPPDVDGLTLCPPGQTGGVLASLPADGERVHLEADGQRIAQVFNLGSHLIVGMYPTTSWRAGDPMSPSGLWHLSVAGTSATPLLLWVARDDTLSGLPEAGRQSWFRDPGYQIFDGMGDLLRRSAQRSEGLRRDGTVSVIATAGSPATVVVGYEHFGARPYRLAGLQLGEQEHPAPSPGAFKPAAEVSRRKGGPMVAKRLGGGVLRPSGTSMASAIQARQSMQDMIGGPAGNELGHREDLAYRY